MKPTDELPVIFADRVQSLNYDGPDGAEIFADAGTSIELTTGTITSTGLVVDGVTGNLQVRGDVTAAQLIILDNAGTGEAARFFTTAPGSLFNLDTGFVFAFPSVAAARTRGVEGSASGALGVDAVGIGGKIAKFSSQVSTSSELAGGNSYQYGTAEVYGYSNIDTGYAEATLNVEAMLGSPAGSGAVSNTSLKVIAVPEGYTDTSVPYSIEAQGSLRIRQGFNTVLTADTTGLTVPVNFIPTADAGPRYQWRSGIATATPATSFTNVVVSSASINRGIVSAPITPVAPRTGWYAYNILVRVDRDCGYMIGVVKVTGNQIENRELTTTARVRGMSLAGIAYITAGGRLEVEVRCQFGAIIGGSDSVFHMTSLFP